MLLRPVLLGVLPAALVLIVVFVTHVGRSRGR
jgi:hypothetical protein